MAARILSRRAILRNGLMPTFRKEVRMKKLMVCVAFLSAITFGGSAAIAGSCYSDSVVKGWIEERDRAEEYVVQIWARGGSPEQFASEVAVILSNELYMCSKCRDEGEFLKTNLHILGKGSDPKVETVPGVILERLVGYEMLSPRKQFPSYKKKEAAKR